MKHNLKIIITTTGGILGTAISVFFFTFIVLAWTGPSSTPPTCPAGEVGCDSPLHTGTSAQSKAGGLLLNTGGATNGLIVENGNVGIGLTDPTEALDVSGNIKLSGYVEAGCPSDMVAVGDFCVDKYEATAWSASSGGSQYGSNSDNYPCSDNGNDCSSSAANPIYARSVSGYIPSRYITWFQANQACANVGKHVCTDQEWLMAAAGTPDNSTDCNINTSAPETGGNRSNCKSNWGAYDMVGNLWEWTANWYGADSATNVLVSNALYSSDYQLDVDPADNQGNGANFPAAARRGGPWSDGSGAGVFALSLAYSPSQSTVNLGFRCCRQK